MNNISLYLLGAGQEVGRSCILIDFGNFRVLLDCGLQMSFGTTNKVPSFKNLFIKYNTNNINNIIDIVLISHFHLDHCGSLPILTEKYNYSNPIIMSNPTRSILPYMLNDYIKISNNNKEKSENNYFSIQDINNCLNKITTINIKETIYINNCKVIAYYAGHVLGAVAFYFEYDNKSVLYTGDFNSTSDSHLNGIQVSKLNPDILITETTYANIFRDSKKKRESELIDSIISTIFSGGKVLIPVFALGRAQELCLILENFISKTDIDINVYFTKGMIEKVNFYYNLYVNWMNFKIKNKYLTTNTFDFKKIKIFKKSLINFSEPNVVFASPGMLHGGFSLEIFKSICDNKNNLIIFPGYCVSGTIGNKVLSGAKKINIDGKNYDVNCKILKISFSAHSDSRGIIELIKEVNPKNVIFVHGDKNKMEYLQQFINNNIKINTFCPENFNTLNIPISENKNIIIESKLNFNNIVFYDKINNKITANIIKNNKKIIPIIIKREKLIN